MAGIWVNMVVGQEVQLRRKALVCHKEHHQGDTGDDLGVDRGDIGDIRHQQAALAPHGGDAQRRRSSQHGGDDRREQCQIQRHPQRVQDGLVVEHAVRGPYGNHFPVEDKLKGKNLLFIAGGIGLAPLRSVINYVLDNREDYGTVDILYGSRSADDLVQLKEIQEVWMKAEGVNVYLTIDREQEGWDGHVGFVPSYLKEIGFDTNKTALVCGPPIMIKFVLAGLEELGFSREQVYTTLELRMKCGIGKCGRCNIGSKYVCKDGPVFRCDEIDELPAEY